MAQESQNAQNAQNAEDRLWPAHIEKMFIDIMVDEQQKGNMEHGIFKGKIWLSMTNALNEQTGKSFRFKQLQQKHNRLRTKQKRWSQLLSHTGLGWDETTQTVTASEEVWANVTAADSKANSLRKSGCPGYDKLRQLFAGTAATGAFQISSNTPAPDSDEERALEEEIANERSRIQLGADDCYNPDMDGITQDDPLPTEQTQRADKRPMEEPTGKGKKVAKKSDKASEMTIALQEYTVLARERFTKKKGKFMGSSDHVAQSAAGGDPCSLGRALEVLNQYNDLDDDTYINISEVLQKKKRRVVFMGMPEQRRKRWMERFAHGPEN